MEDDQTTSRPYWRRDIEAFVAELPTLPWLEPQGEPDPVWRVFETGRAAWMVTRRVARRNNGWLAAIAAAEKVAAHAIDDCAYQEAQNDVWFAAWDAASNGVAVWDAVADAAKDAVLWASVLMCQDLSLPQTHIEHARARMDVWRRGYGLLCDVDGKLYVYQEEGER